MKIRLFSLFLLFFLFSNVYSDSNGIWINAEDVRGGTFGEDETPDDFVFSGDVNVSGFLQALNSLSVYGNITLNGVPLANLGGLDSITSDMIVDGTITLNDIDISQIQSRIDDACSANDRIISINADGTVFCGTNDDADSSVINELQFVIPNQGLFFDTANNFGLRSCVSGAILKRTTDGSWLCAVDSVNDDDNVIGNEFQSLTLVGNQLSLSDGNTITLVDNVDDNDNVVGNEFQSLTLVGNQLGLTDGNSVTLVDNVDDADNVIGNEIQFPILNQGLRNDTANNLGLRSCISSGAILKRTTDGSWLCAVDNVNDDDSSITNEIQGVLNNQGLRVNSTNNKFGLINTCAVNQVLKWNGGAWTCRNEADPSSTNEIQGVLSNQGLRVSGNDFGLTNTCTSGQILKYDGSKWVCADDLNTAMVSIMCPIGEYLIGFNSTGGRVCAPSIPSESTCIDMTWSPDPSEVCSVSTGGSTFNQSSNCGSIREVTGIKSCGSIGTCGEATVTSDIFYFLDDFLDDEDDYRYQLNSVSGCTSGDIGVADDGDKFFYTCDSLQAQKTTYFLNGVVQTRDEDEPRTLTLTCNSEGDWEYSCSGYHNSDGVKRCILSDVDPAPTCTDSAWSPLPATVCDSVLFTQTSNCGNENVLRGTMLGCNYGGSTGSGPTWDDHKFLWYQE